jgi:hypothetical protein
MWADAIGVRAQDQYCGPACNQCGPGAPARINDCGPGRGFYCKPGVQLVQAATLTCAHLEQAGLESTHLKQADLEGAHLEGAHLPAAHLGDAWLADAHLEGAELCSAHLERAGLVGTHLEGAKFGGTYPDETGLEDAHLEGARSLTVEQLASVATLYRAHLDPPFLEQIQQQYPHLLEKPQIRLRVHKPPDGDGCPHNRRAAGRPGEIPPDTPLDWPQDQRPRGGNPRKISGVCASLNDGSR